jgi:Domain of unknown function (DUF4129)
MLSEGDAAPRRRMVPQSADAIFAAALVVMLVLLVTIGLHARLPRPRFSNHSRDFYAAVTAGLEVVVIALLVLVKLRSSYVARTRSIARATLGETGNTRVPDRLRELLGWILWAGAAALAVLLVILLGNLHVRTPGSKGGSGRERIPPLHRPPPVAKSYPSTLHFAFASVLYALLVAAIVIVIVLLALRERSRLASRAVGAQDVAEEDLSTWHDTLVGGRRAFMELDDARAAIIACYAAMAARLSQGDTEHSAADTPDEFLHKVAGTLTFSEGSARRLTDLFYEARFSSHPMGDDERAAASAALDELVTDLSHQRGRSAPPLVGPDGDAVPAGST